MTDNNTFVDLTVVGFLQEADVIRAVLESQGIPAQIVGENTTNMFMHMSLALNTKGVRILVPQSRLEEAREAMVVRKRTPEEETDLGFNDTEADHCAKRSYDSALYSLIFFPMVGFTIYYFAKALSVRKTIPPADHPRFRKRLLLAMLVGIIPYVVLGLILSWALAGDMMLLGIRGIHFEIK